jgi:alkanesulfonate monooxygenase SsuD/methylene tetrahydromethanopterin reductase-like flavin-dependent oxidoreductase (luciferase family)
VKHSFKAWAQQADWPTLRDIWIEADRGGFWDVVWLNDHLYPPKSARSLPILDAWTLFGGLGIRFGTMVSANTFRHPVLLAKAATTLDNMSNGRLLIGVGTGWHEGEHEDFGLELPPMGDRFDMLDETFTIIDGLMTNDVYSFDGRHTKISNAVFEPKPVQNPRPPFVVGGFGPKRTIPLAARWADHWNFPDYTGDSDLFVDRLRLLDEACVAIGRDRSEIEVSVQFRYPNDIAKTVDLARKYQELGAEHILVSFTPPIDPKLPPLVAEALAG